MRVASWRALLAFALIGCGAFAQAAPISFNFTFAQAQGPARAVGRITFESTLLPNPANLAIALPDPSVLDLTVTVTGSTGGDGTFALADFDQIYFSTNGATLDLTRELVGQATNGLPWGTTPSSGDAGDFNIFGAGCQTQARPSSAGYAPAARSPSAPAANGLPPLGDFFFTLGAACDTAELMVLTSFAPVGQPQTTTQAPALGLWQLLALAGLLGVAGAMASRRLPRGV